MDAMGLYVSAVLEFKFIHSGTKKNKTFGRRSTLFCFAIVSLDRTEKLLIDVKHKSLRCFKCIQNFLLNYYRYKSACIKSFVFNE